MKVLVLGAGAVGGYFGGRLIEKGADVTFLVREKRKQQLARHGLHIHSVHGDLHIEPKLIVAGEAAGPFDVILFSTKAYNLADGIESITPYVGEQTTIIPLLNGMAHHEQLKQRFGSEKVLGGLCFIETTLNAEGDVVHTSKMNDLLYGEWSGERTERIARLEELFAGTKAVFRSTQTIQRDMWHKYLFITTLSGMTTLMNASVGPIRDASDGAALTRQLAEEAAAIMRKVGAPISDSAVDRQMQVFMDEGYAVKASMLRDMEKGLPVEADHLQGYLLELAKQHDVPAPLLTIVYNNLQVYQIKRSQGIK